MSAAGSAEWRRKKAADLEGIALERRFIPAEEMEIREADDGTLHVVGYASIYDHVYDMGWHTEEVSRGAAKRTLSESPDVIFVVNHGLGGGMPLARTKSGTLSLSEDHRGLHYDASLDPEDPDAQSLARKMRRGDISECSMAFRCTDDKWDKDYTHRVIRTLSLARGDVSVVNFAANPAATAEMRAREAAERAKALRSVPDYATRAKEELDLYLLRAGMPLTHGPAPRASRGPGSTAAELNAYYARQLDELRNRKDA